VPVRLAVLGDPLTYTLSPALHRAGRAALGRDGTSAARRTAPAELAERLRALSADGVRGVNLTAPHKAAALALVTSASDAARRARSINTVRFDADSPAAWYGDTTDGPGFVDGLASVGRRVDTAQALVLGAGGAARAVTLALLEHGARVTWAARRATQAAEWDDLAAARLVAWPSPELDEAVARATLVVNATPESAPERPIAPARTARDAVLVDLTYGAELTPWVVAARAVGRTAFDGLGMLVGQARRSFGVWFGELPPFETLARAVGWPR